VSEPEFLDLEDVLLIHREQLLRFGGGDGLRDQGLLESAIAMPRATFVGQYVHESLFAMAAAYAFHIAENQPSSMATSGRPYSRQLSSSRSTASS